jgi:hypothetical protein
MGQISAEISGLNGSVLGGNQHSRPLPSHHHHDDHCKQNAANRFPEQYGISVVRRLFWSRRRRGVRAILNFEREFKHVCIAIGAIEREGGTKDIIEPDRQIGSQRGERFRPPPPCEMTASTPRIGAPSDSPR